MCQVPASQPPSHRVSRTGAKRQRRGCASVASAASAALDAFAALASFASLALILLGMGCSPAPSAGTSDQANLLAGRMPSKSQGVERPEVLTDGVMAVGGDPWKSELTAVFASEAAFVEYDLGRSVTVRAGYLQADNNDTYVVSLSESGTSFLPVLTVPPRPGTGLQAGLGRDLSGTGRYVRIAVSGGDRAFGMSEVQLFSEIPEVFPPRLPLRAGLDPAERVRSGLLLFGFALVVFVAASAEIVPKVLRWGALVFPLATGFSLFRAFYLVWPAAQREVSLVRATAAAVAAAIVVGEAFLLRKWRPDRRIAVAVLGICAAASIDSFFNLGYPQFWDHKNVRPGMVHNFDMRVYYPVAKYFKELRFDGLYLASVAAYVDDDPRVTLSSLAKTELRDLRTHGMTRVSQVEGQIQAVKARFSPERWKIFIEDMRYFRENMGVGDYLGSMTDHGGNATPVWIALAQLLYAHTSASNETLLAGALLDPALLLLMFVVIGRTFGLRTMLLSMVIFGANDFYMFGTNWAGATLRHDWLAYLGLGICALKAERWRLGGALLAMAAMIRAFPALALIFTAAPLGWWVWDHWKTHARLPTLREIGPRHPLVRIAIGAASCAFAAWFLSSLLISFSSWIDWIHKVSILDRDPHVNDVSLRAFIAGSGGNQHRVLSVRLPLFLASIVAIGVALIAGARQKRFDQAAVLGLLLIPIVFNPANYYIHFICLLPLLASEGKWTRAASDQPPLSRGDAGNWIALLAMCAAQYWTVLEHDTDLHFQMATALYFAATTVFLVITLRDATSAGRSDSAEPSTAAPVLRELPAPPAPEAAGEPAGVASSSSGN